MVTRLKAVDRVVCYFLLESHDKIRSGCCNRLHCNVKPSLLLQWNRIIHSIVDAAVVRQLSLRHGLKIEQKAKSSVHCPTEQEISNFFKCVKFHNTKTKIWFNL